MSINKNTKKIVLSILSLCWLSFSAIAQESQSRGGEESGPPPSQKCSHDKWKDSYFCQMRLNTQKMEDVPTGNYLREDYICQQVPSACRNAENQDPEDRWYPALPAYTTWQDDGAAHSHEGWTPAPSGELNDFQQSQTYQQPQSRLRQEREQAVPSGDYRNVGEPQPENRDDERVETRTVNVTVLAFQPDGNSFDCSSWQPPEGSVDFGETFTQTRNCSQNAQRDIEYYVEGTLISTLQDNGVVTVEESQQAVGTRDYTTGERAGEWGNWEDSSALYACGEWTPTPDTQPLDSTFTQTADCSIDQTRTRQVYNVFASGAETPKRTESEEQTVARQDSRENIGSKDYITGERAGAWENHWEIVQPQVNTGCDGWTPARNTVDWGGNFTQTRNCSTTEEDFRTIYDVYKSGKEESREKEQRTRPVGAQESRGNTGTRDYVASTYEVDGGWVNQGALYNCVWTPDPDTIDDGVTFTQNGQCDRNQKKTFTTYNVWASKAETGRADSVASTREENRTVKENTTRQQTGTGQPVIEYGVWGAWSTTATENCTAWSPATNTVNWGVTFTQNRDCDYQQERFRSRTNVYPSGRREALSDQRDTRTLASQSESRSAQGTRDYEASTRTSNGSWTNSGAVYNCTWTPDPNTIDQGESFTQTGDCSQNQTRTVTIYTVWASKPDTGRADTVKSTSSESRTISTSPTRTQTGTGQPVIEYGAWSAYSTYNTRDCTSWTPSVGSVDYGQSFTQSRSCTYDQERTRTRTNVYPSGRREALSDERQTRSLTGQSESQPAVGEKESEVSTYNTYSSWTNSGGAYNCTWSPSPSTVDVGVTFTQTGDCSQNQTRTVTTWSKWASGKPDSVKSTSSESRTISTSPTRSETGTGQPTVEYGAWGNYSTYNKTSCTIWSPSESTVNWGQSFTQSRTCTYQQERYRSRTNVYPSGRREALSDQRGTRDLIGQSESRSRTGTKDYVASTYYTYDNWSTVANDKSCSSWTPAASSVDVGTSFTQTRTCVDGQQRTRTTMQRWASKPDTGRADTVGGTATESRDVNDNQSRTQTGTGQPTLQCGGWSGYSTYNKSCNAFSPSESTVNWGQSFTQTRSCTYYQERTRTCNYVYPSGRTEATSDGERGTRTLTGQSESRTSTGTKDYVTSEYTNCGSYSNSGSPYACSGWSPSTSSMSCGTSFTQTQSCSQTQSRSCQVMQRWASKPDTGRADTVKSGSGSTQSRTISVDQSRSATGGNPTATNTYYEYTSWTTYSNDASCTAWTPANNTRYQGESFTQTRTCQDLQDRNRTTVTEYNCGGADTRSGTTRQTRSVNDNQSRPGDGELEPWGPVGSRECDPNTERDKGSPTYASGSSWSPAASGRGTSTSSYTQTRAGVQPREHLCFNTERNAVSGDTRRTNEYYETTTSDPHTFSRAVSVTRVGPYNNGSPSYTSYSPATNTVCSGTSFTQSRTVTQKRDYRNDHKTGGSTFYSRVYAASSTTSTQTRSATGTKVCMECNYGTNYIVQEEESCEAGWGCDAAWQYYWAGSVIASSNNSYSSPSSVTSGGYVYSRGAHMDGGMSGSGGDNYETWEAYQICRTPQ